MTLAPEAPAPSPPPADANTYDAVPYSVNAFPQTTPNRLAVIAALFALDSPSPDRCRVLELGCAAGGNIIPMALIHPHSHFVGIDLSQRQIADGHNTIQHLALTNIQLHHKSILDLTPDLGTFDYILAHGVYSWVPPQVQDKILTICRDQLSPNGVAYISYNTYPGWHSRGAIREMLWYHTEHLTDPAQRIRQARVFLTFLAKSVLPQANNYSALILQELALLLRTPDSYLLHEHLEECNEPLYFHQFAGRAMAKGLQYLAEAQLSAMLSIRFGDETDKVLRAFSPDLLHMEQYMDFLRNRMFRQTLLCRDHVPLQHALRPDAVTAFHVASPLEPESKSPDLSSTGSETFAIPGKPKLATQDPLMKAALATLGKAWPKAIPFNALFEQACQSLPQHAPADADQRRNFAARLLHAYAAGLVEFTLTPSPFTTILSDRPLASPYARFRAPLAKNVTNLRLESVAQTDASRLLLTHLDGRHDREQLIALLTDWLTKRPPEPILSPLNQESKITPPSPPPASPRDRAILYLDHLLPAFAQAALLIA